MNSRTTAPFWGCYRKLPTAIRKQAKESYSLFFSNPYHPSLQFKRIHSVQPIFSVRITKNYRAVGITQRDEIIWFWIGSHADYDKLLKKLRNT